MSGASPIPVYCGTLVQTIITNRGRRLSQEENCFLMKLHTWAAGQDENFVSYAFAHLLRHLLEHDPFCALLILSKVTQCKIAHTQWQTALVRINTQGQ